MKYIPSTGLELSNEENLHHCEPEEQDSSLHTPGDENVGPNISSKLPVQPHAVRRRNTFEFNPTICRLGGTTVSVFREIDQMDGEVHKANLHEGTLYLTKMLYFILLAYSSYSVLYDILSIFISSFGRRPGCRIFFGSILY